MEIQGRIVFITGSAVRVGKSVALLLAQKGAQTIIHYHTREKQARETAREISEIGRLPLIVQGDVSKREDWLRMKEEVNHRLGNVDVLINNAAIFYKTPLNEITDIQWNHFMDVNLKSVFLGSQIFGKQMYEQKSGKIINLADIAAEKIWAEYIPYCVSKAGVVGLTKGFAKALAPYVTVNAIAPGDVLLPESFDKDMEAHLIRQTPLKKIGSAEDIARLVGFIIEGGDFINGSIINVDGGKNLL